MIRTKKRVFGPFWGEFGWEIAQWAPYVNAMTNALTNEGDVLLCQPGHYELYGTDIVSNDGYPRPDQAVPDMMGCDMENHGWLRGTPQVKPVDLKIKLVKGVPVIDSKLLPIPIFPACAEARRFVVLHCRGIYKCPERNMTPERWEALVAIMDAEGLDPPLVIGSKDDYLPRLCLDRRGCTLEETISYMRTAKVVVGASSGPMHLAQACEAPIAVWSGNARKDKPRYKEVWNHFDSPTTFVSPSWSPGVGKIMKAIEQYL